jgi:hypothetical protein
VCTDIVECKNLHARADVRRGDAINAHNALWEESIRTDTRSTHEQTIERAGAWLLECSGFVSAPSLGVACVIGGGADFRRTLVMLNTSPLECSADAASAPAAKFPAWSLLVTSFHKSAYTSAEAVCAALPAAAAVGSEEEATEDRQRNERRAADAPRDSTPDAHRRLIAFAAWMAAAVEKQRRCRADTDRLIGAAAAAGPAAATTAATELLPALAAAMVRAADRIVCCFVGLRPLVCAAKGACSLVPQSRPVATGSASASAAC